MEGIQSNVWLYLTVIGAAVKKSPDADWLHHCASPYPPIPSIPVKSAQHVLACILEIKLCKTNYRETLHMPEDNASNANASQTWRKGLPVFVARSVLAGDRVALTGRIWKHPECWHDWLCLVRKCMSVFVFGLFFNVYVWGGGLDVPKL